VKIRTTVLVRGRVQGVGFRYYTAQTAKLHSLTGWVMNLRDGSVKACFEGEEEEVRSTVKWCSIGPDLAQVEEFWEESGGYTGEFNDFFIGQEHE
jgi:acylphosphatase